MNNVVFALLFACTCVSPTSNTPLEHSEISLKVRGGSRHPVGRNLFLECDYVNGSTIPDDVDVAWEKDGVLLDSVALGDRVRSIKRQLASRAIIIVHSVVNDSGRYQCVVDGQRSPEVEVTIVVIPEPYVNMSKTNFLCDEGETLHISLVMRNILGFRFTFKEEDVSHLRYKYFSENGTLTIYSVRLSDSGVYTVYGGNAVGYRIVNFNITVIGHSATSPSPALTSAFSVATTAFLADVHSKLSDGMDVGLVVGVTVGVSMLVVLIIAALIVVWHRSRRLGGNYTSHEDKDIHIQSLN